VTCQQRGHDFAALGKPLITLAHPVADYQSAADHAISVDGHGAETGT
jgi:hypothetical protein